MRGIHYSLVDSSKEPKVEKYQSNFYIFSYPCESKYVCSPYKVELSKGAYKIECYGAGNSAGGVYFISYLKMCRIHIWNIIYRKPVNNISISWRSRNRD